MAKKKKLKEDDWAKELAGTPVEQWARAQEEIRAYEAKLEKAIEEGANLIDKAENEGYIMVDRAESEASILEEAAQEEADELINAAQKELDNVRKMYTNIRKAAESVDVDLKKKKQAKLNKLNKLREKIWNEPDIDKAINLLEKGRKLIEEIDNG